jgi:hypothetical protein
MTLNQYDPSSIYLAIELLQKTTGLHIEVRETPDQQQDGYLQITTDEGRQIQLPYDVKKVIDRRDQLFKFKTYQSGTLLITRSISSTMAEYCRELNIQFIDYAGNCFLSQPGLHIYISGAKNTSKIRNAEERGLTPATLRVVFAILNQPSILNSSVRRIAEISLVSHGAAGIALITLEERGFFISTKAGHRILSMPEQWLDAWTEGYLGRIRPKLKKLRMSSSLPLSEVLQDVEFKATTSTSTHEVTLGGEAAAAFQNMGLKPGSVTLYMDLKVPNTLLHVAQDLMLRRDTTGNIEVIDIFWNTHELPSSPTVPNTLIYADLVKIGDERTMEIASYLRKEICKYVASQA